MPAHRARNAQHRRLSALDAPPYPPARASTSHPADPASSAAAQTPGPLTVLQAMHASQTSQASDMMSIDDVSTEQDSPPGPGDWAACGTGIGDERDQSRTRVQGARLRPAKLELLDWAEWDQTKAYDERPPTCLHYSIVWKISLNNKVVSRDTEQDLVLAPQHHWSFILRSKLLMLVQKKLAKHGKVTCDDVNVVVKNTGRSEWPLVRRFDQTAINWTTVERQLVEWGELFRAGKKLIVEMTFNCTPVSVWVG